MLAEQRFNIEAITDRFEGVLSGAAEGAGGVGAPAVPLSNSAAEERAA
jgi:hypothetical protein